MRLGEVISNLRSLGTKLLPCVSTSQASSSSSYSSSSSEGHDIEADLQRLMKMLEVIKAMLYDAEVRVVRDCSVKRWLKDLKQVASEAEDLLDEYQYEMLRATVEAREATLQNTRNWKQVQVPDKMFDRVKEVMGRFDEIETQRRDFHMFQEDAPRRPHTELQIVPTSQFIIESNIFGREKEKEYLIDLLSAECHDGNIVSAVTIVGMGGLGKTTLAQLVYNDQRIEERFDKCGWVCVSEDFNVERLTRELVESIAGNNCSFINLNALQKELREVVDGKEVLLVLDDVWNENASLWEQFRAPLEKAASVKILVTTRNEHVAQIMQTVTTFKLGHLSEERCWQMFQHYAFGQVNQNEGSTMVEIGKKILKKCGMLPLAIKAIASLLRDEKEEESWKHILESELWESDASNEIFPPLQISYARLPTHLKPCFLYCSIFPKAHKIYLDELIRLWTYQGYIKSSGKFSAEKIGWQYAKQLWQRSFLEGKWGENEFLLANAFKLHDIIHDLARFNSDGGFYSIEAGKVPDFPKELYHLYVDARLQKPLQIATLRTLILHSDAKNVSRSIAFSVTHKLRALEVSGPSLVRGLEFFSPHDNFKHLRYLFLFKFSFHELPECICSLYHLQTLTLLCCKFLRELPKSIGNLISLEDLKLHGSDNLNSFPESFCELQALRKLDLGGCYELKELPNDIGKLINLQTLSISASAISYLPPSLNKLSKALKIIASLQCTTIDWLEGLVDFGNLSLTFLGYMPSLTNVRCAPLVSMHNLKCLELCFDEEPVNVWNNALHLTVEGDQNVSPDDQNDFALMFRLQPHRNLRELCISGYRGVRFPEWIGNPILCPSLTKIVIVSCQNIEFLPFGGFCNLNHLEVCRCSALSFLGTASLPPALQKLSIDHCDNLTFVYGIQKLKLLKEITIRYCESLQLVMDVGASHVEHMISTIRSSYHNSLVGLRNLASLTSLHISNCPKLQMFTHELPPLEACEVEVSCCPGLKEWCLQHNISYWDSDDDDNDNEDSDGSEVV